eukprot:888624-Amphidinium_carterae.1
MTPLKKTCLAPICAGRLASKRARRDRNPLKYLSSVTAWGKSSRTPCKTPRRAMVSVAHSG